MAGLADLDYQKSGVQNTSGELIGTTNEQSARSGRSLGTFTQEANEGLDKSNLMGPSAGGQDSQTQALQNRANQIYQSQRNQLERTAEMGAADRKFGLQKQDAQNQAAIYDNTQKRAEINYKQVAYARASAIQQESMRKQLVANIFGGAAGVIGAGAGMLMNANQPATYEQRPGGFQGGAPQGGNFNYSQGQMSPDSFQSAYFGKIGGR